MRTFAQFAGWVASVGVAVVAVVIVWALATAPGGACLLGGRGGSGGGGGIDGLDLLAGVVAGGAVLGLGALLARWTVGPRMRTARLAVVGALAVLVFVSVTAGAACP